MISKGCPYIEYYARQAAGGAHPYMGEGRGLPFYRGADYQRGHGVGSFLRGLFRTAYPILRSAAAVVGREAARAGSQVMLDTLAHHKPLRSSLRDQWEASSGALAQKAHKSIRSMVGRGIKRRKTSKRRQSLANHRGGRTVKKRTKLRPSGKIKRTKKKPKPKNKNKAAKRKKKKSPPAKPHRRRRVHFTKQDIFG